MKSFHFFLIIIPFFTLFSIFSDANEINILVDINPGKDFTAKSNELKGSAQLNKDQKIMVQNAELDLNSLTSGVSMRDSHMKDNYFETKIPGNEKALLKKAIGTGGTFKGLLLIRGVSKEIKGTYELKDGNSKVEFKFETLMSDFKIKKASYMGVGALDKVQVTGTLPILKK